MTMLLQSLKELKHFTIFEDSRMSGACGVWHVVVNVGKLGENTQQPQSTCVGHSAGLQNFKVLNSYNF